MYQVLRRKNALLAGKLRYYTGMMCRNGHDCQRYTSNGACVECIRPRSIRAKLARSTRTVRLTLQVPLSVSDEGVTRLSHWINDSCLPAFWKAEYERVLRENGIDPAEVKSTS